MNTRDNNKDLSRREMDELIQFNQSFPHSYLVHNPRERVFAHEISSRVSGGSSELEHLKNLNAFTKCQFDFSTSSEEKEKVKVMKARCK